MPNTIYQNNSSLWPVQQNTTEVKHASGLLTASAEFVNTTETPPLVLKTSIGELGIYPPPSLNQKDGLYYYSATAYGIWDPSNKEESYGTTSGEITLRAKYYLWKDQSTQTEYGPVQEYIETRSVLLDTYYVKTVSNTNAAMPSCPVLHIRSLSGGIIDDQDFSISGFETAYTQVPVAMKLALTTNMLMIKRNQYGKATEEESYVTSVFETEASFEAGGTDLFFGVFYQKNTVNQNP